MKWQPKNPLSQPSQDPYFAWAEDTAWRGFRRVLGQRLGTGDVGITKVRLLVQANDEKAAARAMAWDEWEVADIYRRQAGKLRHFVAEMPLGHLEWLRSLSHANLRWELALPFRDAETTARAQPIGAYGESRDAGDFRPPEYFDVVASESESDRLRGPVMAVIDFGCPFMNEAFLRRDGSTRVEALWDQGASCTPPAPLEDGTQPPWPWSDVSACMGYGRAMRGARLDRILDACRALGDGGDAPDETEAYRRIDYLIDYDDARRRVWTATHGCHVLSVAAGSPDPLLDAGTVQDAAASASLVFVQLPSLTAADSGGGSLSAQVLDAVHYVLSVCAPGAKIVINLSYGSFAGPHDGSSLIEQALDEVIQKRGRNLAIVLGAGNSKQAACHAMRSVGVNRSALLRIHLDEGDYTDSFVETWFVRDSPWRKNLRGRVRTAQGDWSDWIAPGEEAHMLDGGDRRPMATLSFQSQVPNGQGALLLLAVAPTARPADDDGPLAPSGSWHLEVKLQAEAGESLPEDEVVVLRSWIERDDPGWLGHGVQPRFEEQRHGDSEQTLSSLATGKFTIAVGGYRLSDSAPAVYSSTGHREGPALVYGACEESADSPDIRAAAVRSDDTLRMSGTSVAAPVLARRILNWMADPVNPDVEHDGWEAALTSVVQRELDQAKFEQRPAVLRHGPVTQRHGLYD